MNHAPSKKSWSIRDLLSWATQDFQSRGIETARLDAELLLAHANSCSRVDLYLRFEECPPEPVLARFREAVKRRRNRESVAHIVGHKSFHEIELLIRPGVFVPRPETELLVDEALIRLHRLPGGKPRILDLGTGTGAIALSLLHALPQAVAYATDLDPAAVDLAQENAKHLGVADRLHLFLGDLFAPVSTFAPFDLIASNPPYVPTPQIASLMPEVREHESRLALDGGPDGLEVVRRIVSGASSVLSPGGWLLLEVGEGQAPEVEKLVGPGLVHEETRLDLRGIPRVVIFQSSHENFS